MRIILWFISVLFVVLLMYYQATVLRPVNFSDFFDTINFISLILALFFMGAVAALLGAFIPFRKKKYLNKFSFAFPLSVSVIAMVLFLNFYSTGPHYHSIVSPPGQDYASVREGRYVAGFTEIVRYGSNQKETNLKTLNERHPTVTWKSESEYELNFSGQITKVKIVAVDSNGYDCYTYSEGRTSIKRRVSRVR